MLSLNEPLFCITSDVDWASDYAIRDFIDVIRSYGIKPTVFATHASDAISELKATDALDVGIHPNFLPGSSHGADQLSVIEHMVGTFPDARCFRSHCYADNTLVTRELVRRGYKYDSNLCLYLQPNLVPLRHESGLLRFPVFWEDDTHWINSNGDWDLAAYLPAFLSPGLKILNIHPFFFAANIPEHQYYKQVHEHITTLDADSVDAVRHAGEGVRSFVIELLELLTSRRERVLTLQELYETLPTDTFTLKRDETTGRQTAHTDEDYERYWSASEAERQEFVRRSYDQRNPTDIYATSRDFNVRELEVAAIKRQLGEKGPVLDLGCGNGYTLLSIAEAIDGWDLVGVDFSEPLIEGAKTIRASMEERLQSHPDFVCGDAISYISECEPESARYIVTERFLLNLPSPEAQQKVIREAHRVLVPGGVLLMCEGSENGFDALNRVRECVGLPAVPATSSDNITSIRFKDDEIERFAEDEVGFVLRDKAGFGSYFLMTRVLHPLLAAPLSPRFDARINELSARVQHCIPFAPGYGANVLWVFEKRQAEPVDTTGTGERPSS